MSRRSRHRRWAGCEDADGRLGQSDLAVRFDEGAHEGWRHRRRPVSRLHDRPKWHTHALLCRQHRARRGLGSGALHPKSFSQPTGPLESTGEAMKPLTLLAAVAVTTALLAHLSSSNGVASAAQGPTGTARIVVKGGLSGPAPPAVKVQTSADP